MISIWRILFTLGYIILFPFLRLYYARYRWVPNFKDQKLKEMDPADPEGYTNKPFYLPTEKILFYLKSSQPFTLKIERISSPGTFALQREYKFDKVFQETDTDPAINGAGWKETFSVDASEFAQGYYRTVLTGASGSESFITFLVGSSRPSADVVIIAPVTTWIAYNLYGGRSAYKNIVDRRNIHKLSTQRPNPSLQYKRSGENIQDMNVEANVFNWFHNHYDTVLLPDTALEEPSSQLKNAKIIVLSYHCEYVSPLMYRQLLKMVYKEKRSLISLGGNQIYWKVVYNKDRTILEVRKDHSWFDNKILEGGLWRQTLSPEISLLGVQFTGAGAGSYAPYKVLAQNHWLYKGSDAQNGDLFGMIGIDHVPICGDETDKTIRFISGDVEVIAKGINGKIEGQFINYPDSRYEWDSSGGGELILKTISANNAVLSTGAVHSGSGLGIDFIFTLIVKNFTDRYLQ